MSKVLFSGVLLLLVALGSGSSIECQTSQVFKDLHKAIINKEQRAEELARRIDDECINVLYAIDGHPRARYYWNNLNASTYRSTTIINLALYYDQTNVAEILIERRANLLIKDSHGNTALHIASYRGHKTVVIMILDKIEPQDIDLQDNVGATALHLAVYHKRADVIEVLLKFANPFITDKYKGTALTLALEQCRSFVAVIFMIIDAARQHSINTLGQNVMTDPSSCSSPNLLHDGRDRDIIPEAKAMSNFINLKNNREQSAFLIAIAANWSVDIVELLLDNGADPKICDSHGNTALGLAVMYKRGVNIISAIITPARRQNIQNVMTDPSVCSSPNLGQDGRGRVMTRESMLEFINSKNPRGHSALHIAITTFNSSLETVQCLLNNGADPRICDSHGNTALAAAIKCNRGVNYISPIIAAVRQQLMHNLGQNEMTGPSVLPIPNLGQDGRDRVMTRESMLEFINSRNRIVGYLSNTALAVAIMCKRGVNYISAIITAVRQQVWSSPNLIQNGRDRVMTRESMLNFINSRNRCGQSAVHLAITHECSVEPLKFLLKHEADPRIPDNNGETALDLAIQNKRHEAIIEIVNAVRNMPKLHFLQNGMTPPLYSGLIQHLAHRRLPIDVISVIFADDMINRWKKSAKIALVWAESTKRDDWAEPTKRDDLVASLRMICDIPKTDASKQWLSVIKDCLTYMQGRLGRAYKAGRSRCLFKDDMRHP